MENWTICKQSNSRGNIMTWSTNYEISSSLIGYKDHELYKLCEPETLGLIILPQKYSYNDGLIACRLI